MIYTEAMNSELYKHLMPCLESHVQCTADTIIFDIKNRGFYLSIGADNGLYLHTSTETMNFNKCIDSQLLSFEIESLKKLIRGEAETLPMDSDLRAIFRPRLSTSSDEAMNDLLSTLGMTNEY